MTAEEREEELDKIRNYLPKKVSRLPTRGSPRKKAFEVPDDDIDIPATTPLLKAVDLSSVPDPDPDPDPDLDLGEQSSDEDGYDNDEDIQEIQKQNLMWEQSEDELNGLKFFSKDDFNIIKFRVWDDVNGQWSTLDKKQRIFSKEFTSFQNFQLKPYHIEALRENYCGPETDYRCYATTFFPAKNPPGVFVFCGCDVRTCLYNAAGSSHVCGYCLHRIHGFCMVREGKWS